MQFQANNATWVCQVNRAISRGVFFGDNPLYFATPLLFVQLSTAALVTAILQFCLTPLGESAFFSQMMAGFLMGPTFWGDRNPIKKIFPPQSHYVGQTFAFFGCMIFLFLVGVKTDISMIKRTGKKAVIIGILTFVVPISTNSLVAAIISPKIKMDKNLQESLYFIAAMLSSTSFHVVVCLLDDLKLLNSELGRLATSSSLVSGICSLSWSVVATIIIQPKRDVMWVFASLACLAIVILYIFRPVMLWMVRQSTEGKPIKEGHICGIFMMILLCAFFSEVVGQHMVIGPMLLGMATPEGPPLGSALVTKLDSFVSSIFLPIYFLIACSGINIRDMESGTASVILFLSFCNFVSKFLATLLPSLYSKMPALDAVSLGFIMTSQGITDVLVLQNAMILMVIDSELFTIMALLMVTTTGITTPLVKFLYTPSRRYISNKKRTMQHTPPDTELRMLAGIYNEYQTPSIINLLELSNPTSKSPICFYVVHLQELVGRSAPLLINHRPDRRNPFPSYGSQPMINAFRLYGQDNEGSVNVNIFTSVSPYATMHEELCNLAMEKRVSMVIVPFHKQWLERAQMEELPKSIRSVNQNVIRDAPCSVGILVDRGTLSGTTSLSGKSLYSIGMIFVEGPDDREALAYAMRMGEHPNVSITVTRLIDSNQKKKDFSSTTVHVGKDELIVNDFKIAHVGKKHHVYKEEYLSDSVETVGVIRSMENTYYDLILVGRRHDNNSPLFMGLTEWNEYPELGFVGDMLASSDSRCQASVLVVQQQTLGDCKKRGSSKHKKDFDPSIFVDIPRRSNKVWPA